MRVKDLGQLEAEAQARSETMVLPVAMMFAGFLLLIGLSGAGGAVGAMTSERGRGGNGCPTMVRVRGGNGWPTIAAARRPSRSMAMALLIGGVPAVWWASAPVPWELQGRPRRPWRCCWRSCGW